MVMCLDTDECQHANQATDRFCAQCGLPIVGSLLQGRYLIQNLSAKDRMTVTLLAKDRHTSKEVTVRVLRPLRARPEDRADFLQDAELALSFSSTMQEPGSICVTDFGEDGPAVFLVKSVVEEQPPRLPATPPMGGYTDNEAFGAGPFPYSAVAAQPAPGAIKSTPPPGRSPLPPAALAAWVTKGDHAYQLGHYEEALAYYERALAENALEVGLEWQRRNPAAYGPLRGIPSSLQPGAFVAPQ